MRPPIYWCTKCWSTDIERLKATTYYWEPDIGWVSAQTQDDWKPPYCSDCHNYDVRFGSPHPSSYEAGRIKLAFEAKLKRAKLSPKETQP